jgi:membrane-bound metal-dependent hydrolase YbcI (DUF457 family)
LFFVGHIAIAFLVTYLLATKFSVIRKIVSIAFVMFLSTLPDIDILVRLLGLDVGHSTITHSAFISAILGVILLYFLARSHKAWASVYLMAYLSHILIGDTIVGPINILYPLGIQFVTVVNYGSLLHITIEFVLFSIMAAITELLV